MMRPSDDALGLLLARDDGRPHLADPLAADTTREGTLTQDKDPSRYYTPGGDPNDLAAQGWSLIVPAGPAGERLLQVVRPLVAKRAEDQGLQPDAVRVFRVPDDPRLRTPEGAAAWSKAHYDDLGGVASDVPLYQLILGDFAQVPLALQQHQSIVGRVGRLFFDREQGYEAYVAKLLAHEAAAPKGPGRVLVHTAHDGSAALRAGHAGLVTPLVELLEAQQERGRSPAGSITVGGGVALQPDLDGFFERTEARDPGVLFTVSHGLGGPSGGWKKEADRRARQGAMTFGLDGFVTGDDLAARPFMPGGVWFMFACYGAGTPDVSAYQHWLERLAALGRVQGGVDVLSGLRGEGPFVARLPQRVLANPEGPLAFIGHVDLAWSYSFQDGDDTTRRRAGQFQRIVEPLLAANRVGVAFAEVARVRGLTETELVGHFDEDARLRADTGDAGRRAFLWMQRNDLAGYILLGDPAARLPVAPAGRRRAAPPAPQPERPATAVASAPPPTPGVAIPAGVDPGKLERALCELIVGERTAKSIAAECGVPAAALEALAKVYSKAGRAALGLPSA